MVGGDIHSARAQATARLGPSGRPDCYSCPAVRCLEENTLFGYVTGALDSAVGDAVRAHLASCDACRRLAAAAVRATPTEPMSSSGLHEIGRGWPLAGGVGERTIAGKYRMIRLIGAGGMGVVYEAINTWTGRRVAIKEIHRSISTEPDIVQRFKLEAKAASRIAHPNVVEILDLGQDPDTNALFMVQELLVGSTLRQRIEERGAFSLDEIVRVIGPVLSAIVAAHDAGVIHRDLKPDNIFLASDGLGGEITKLIDFGLSKQLAADVALDVTGQGKQLGTPFYMSPEQVRGRADLDERTDVWSIGVVLFELFAGVRPFTGPSYNDLVVQIATGPVPKLGDVAPAVPAAISALVARALERDPAERMASRELRDAFDELVLRPEVLSVPQGNPYRGLLPFESPHRGVFFGRTAEISEVVERFRTRSFVLIAGDSGVGKSSLVRAGVLPVLSQSGAAIAMVTPGTQPVAALASAIASMIDEDATVLAGQLADDAACVGVRLQRRLAERATPGPHAVLFVDQLEELLTLADDGEAAFASLALSSLLDAAPALHLIATVRSDFLARLAALPGLGDAVTAALYLCKPLPHHNIREVIVGPARITGLRFESPALVDELVASVGSSAGELPLLQFALSRLWECRDVHRNMICASSLQAIGGVGGALAVFADGVLAQIPTRYASLARHILTSLVTEDGTRARKSVDELCAESRDASQQAVQLVLETFVQGRLVSVEDRGGTPSYQIAHDVLVAGWGSLRGWRGRDIEREAARERLVRAAAEWNRLDRPLHALWNRAQLVEVGELSATALGQSEAEFLERSRRAVRGRRVARYAASLAIPVLVVLGFFSAQIISHRRTLRAIAEHIRAADATLIAAVAEKVAIEQLRLTAFAAFDHRQREVGEAAWTKVIERQDVLDATYRLAGQRLEAALALDGSERAVRSRFAALLAERAQLAEQRFRAGDRDELVQRMAAYDDDGSQQARWNAPASVSVVTTPTSATVMVQRVLPTGLGPSIALGATPVVAAALRPGSYMVSLSAPGRPLVRAPILAQRGEVIHLKIAIPLNIHPGYALIPPGRFLYGSNDNEDIRRALLNAQPLHAVSTAGYLIALHEVSFANWIQFLRSLPPALRRQRLPRASQSAATSAGAFLELVERTPDRFHLDLQPSSHRYAADSGQPIEYASRIRGATQDWLRMPVSGITWDDALAYSAWLNRSGALLGARPCDEHEWERAARGADGRQFPSSDHLQPSDANVAETYGRQPDAFGPDEVGSHPESDSPFGVSDLAGNVWEWVRSVSGDEQVAIRGGAWYYNQVAARSANREPAEPTLRSITIGLRICTSVVEPVL